MWKSIILLYQTQVYYEDDNTYICTPFPQEWKRFNYDKIYSMAHITLFFFVPLIIITICYGIMAHVMVKSSHGLPGETYNGSTLRRKQIRTRRKVANIMIALIFLFFVCWLPRSILTIHRIYATNPPYTPTIHFLRLAALCLMFASGCVNPIVLYFLSKSFKTHFNKQLCCREGQLTVALQIWQPSKTLSLSLDYPIRLLVIELIATMVTKQLKALNRQT
ncbi:NMBR [Bugula neritina]|uniref:NMBR n=1 Tax=Bugula neritina TaxID=10212 RepID=A0A7J7KAP2_BUGNE|nr:NMBR [Bugula neritina]